MHSGTTSGPLSVRTDTTLAMMESPPMLLSTTFPPSARSRLVRTSECSSRSRMSRRAPVCRTCGCMCVCRGSPTSLEGWTWTRSGTTPWAENNRRKTHSENKTHIHTSSSKHKRSKKWSLVSRMDSISISKSTRPTPTCKPNSSISNPFIRMFIRIEYNSDYFTAELTRYLGTIDETQHSRINTRSRDHQVDLRNKKVTKQFYQKFKFEAMKPFEMTQSSKVEFVNNCYMIQAVV